jgi:uncharacterized membrane protein YccC
LRAAIALPGVLALVDWVTGNSDVALFASFAAFGLVALADFGGPPRVRATAYLVATAVGAIFVTVGTILSDEAVAAALIGLVVGFVLVQTASFGGAWSAGMFALALSYVLSATIPGTVHDVAGRVEGWGFGGLVAIALALLLFPVYERPGLWAALADALRAGSGYVRSGGATATRDATRRAVARLHAAYATTPYRPAGPAVRDRAFVAAMDGIDRIADLDRGPAGEPPIAAEGLRDATAALLDAAAVRADDPAAPLPELAPLDAARHRHREALSAWVGDRLRSGQDPDLVLAELERAWWARVMSLLAVSVAADVVIGTGGAAISGELAATLETPIDRTGTGWSRLRRVLHTNLGVSSVRFRNALRTGLGLGLAVLVAGVSGVQHGFWVGLATLSVLRSTALATGRTALQAIGGTCLGFLVVLVFFGVFDAGTTAEWVVFPFAAFLAAYAPSAISFLIGQASFTVAIVLLFDVIVPDGWRTGLVRVEDIAIGAAVSLVVGLLVWPRGAMGVLRRVLGAHLHADADYLDDAMRTLGDGDLARTEASREHAIAAARRVGDAYDELLASSNGVPSDHESWATIAGAARQLEAAADLLTAQVQLGFGVGSYPEATAALRSEGAELTAALRGSAHALEGFRVAPPVAREPTDARRRAEVEVLGRWGGRDAEASAAIGVVWASEVLHVTELAARRADGAVGALATRA